MKLKLPWSDDELAADRLRRPRRTKRQKWTGLINQRLGFAEYQRQYRAANEEKARQTAREWYRNNRDAVNEKRKRLRLDDPEAIRAAARACYARRRKRKPPETANEA